MRIIIAEEMLASVVASGGEERVSLMRTDDDVLSSLVRRKLGRSGIDAVVEIQDRPVAERRNDEKDCVRILVRAEANARETGRPTFDFDGRAYSVSALMGNQLEGDEAQVSIVSLGGSLFSRNEGVLESDALNGKTVFALGLGSVGSTVVRFLAQSGVSKFILMDGDRFEISNPMRHEAGISQVGRLKTRIMRDIIFEKNPYAKVELVEGNLSGNNVEATRSAVRCADLCISSADQREGKALINRICVAEKKPLIYGGCFRRAVGGQVLRVRPGLGPCWQCFARLFRDEESPYPDSAVEIPVYSDRPAPVEPGLAMDIAPICQMTAKLALQELMRGMPTTLANLEEDLQADWYIWVNRREARTRYESLEPLAYDSDGMRIMRWYGVAFDRDPVCLHCAGSVRGFADEMDVDLAEEQPEAFLATHMKKVV